MNTSDDILKAVKTYIETPDTKYAIMIDGDWGCGKTYLWENVIRPEIGEKETIYISLFGLKDIKDIENEIFKSLSFVGEDEDGVLKGILNSNQDISEDIKVGGIGYAVQFGLSFWKKNRLKKSKHLFICFDDIERWAGDIDVCLSYINKSVEHDGTKCLILGNTKEINKDNKETFNASKEKTIGFKYRLTYSPETFLDCSIQIVNFPSDECKQHIVELLNNNSSRIFDLISSIGFSNLRILSLAIYYLAIIYSHNQDKFEPSPANSISYFESLLSAIILVEHYKNSDEDRKIILDPSVKNVIHLEKKIGMDYYELEEGKRELTDDEKIIQKLMHNTFYQSDEIKHKGKFSLITYGFYKDEDFEDEFSEWKPTEDYEYYLDTFKVWYAENDEADRLFKNTYKAMFEDKVIANPSILLLLTDRIINDIKRGVIDLDFEETKIKVRELFDELYENDRMEIVRRFDLRYGNDRFLYCEDIYSEVVAENEEYYKSKENLDRTNYWLKLKENPQKYIDVFDEYEKYEISAMYEDPMEILESLEMLNNAQLFTFTRRMGSRVGDKHNCSEAVDNEHERAQAIAQALEDKYGNEFGVRAGHMKQIARILRKKRTDYDIEFIDRQNAERNKEVES